jgi:SanA protein
LDSVLRCKYIFQQNKVLIISQEFHNYRALFIAQYYGMEVLAFNAKHPSIPTPQTILREYLARTRAVWDVYVAGTQPKFMGDKVEIRLKT